MSHLHRVPVIKRVGARAAYTGISTGPGVNEPSGFVAAFENPMSATPPGGNLDSYGFQRLTGIAGDLAIQTDGSGAASNPNYLRHLFPSGMTGGQVNTTYRAGYRFSGVESADGTRGYQYASPKSRLYTRIICRLSSNWTDNGNTGTKFFFFSQGASDGSTGPQYNNHYINLTAAGALRFGGGTQFNDNSGLNRNFLSTSASFTKGAWHDVEFLLIANTTVRDVSEASDGVFRMWVDGILESDYTDVMYFRRQHNIGWHTFYANPTFGGGANPVPADQWYEIDHWYTSVAV